jgi:threonine aldolase
MNHVPLIDLRSDTVTKPTAEMRRAMANAEVGDDVYGEDPTVNRLETRAADIFERDAAIFVPTGTMGNQIAINVLTRPGQEIICEERSHIYNFEMAMLAQFSGCLARPVRAADGRLTWAEIKRAIAGETYYLAQTGLVELENSSNLCGGIVYTQAQSEEVCSGAHAAGLPVHLDGARIFNAAVALGTTVARLTQKFDAVMFCLSKGLGAPVGSMLVGSDEFIREARKVRKALGGGMRQAGILAAAGLVALDSHLERLVEDHENARRLAEALSEMPGLAVDLETVETNIIICHVGGTGLTAAEFCRRLAERGVLAGGAGADTIRLVTHLDVSRADCERAVGAIGALCARPNES